MTGLKYIKGEIRTGCLLLTGKLKRSYNEFGLLWGKRLMNISSESDEGHLKKKKKNIWNFSIGPPGGAICLQQREAEVLLYS